MKPYDPDKLHYQPNDNVEAFKVFDMDGKQVSNDKLYEVAEQADELNLKKDATIYNPGLPMDIPGVTLGFADINKANLIKA